MQFLVHRKAPRRGDIVAVKPGPHVWGRREHKEIWRAEFGNVDDYPADYIVVRIPDMPEEEAQRLRRRVLRADTPGPIDPITGEPEQRWLIHHNCRAIIDFEGMADNPVRQTRLLQDGIVVRQWAEAEPFIFERGD